MDKKTFSAMVPKELWSQIILEEYKNRMEYIKPSKRKSEKRNAAIRRQRKLDSENI